MANPKVQMLDIYFDIITVPMMVAIAIVILIVKLQAKCKKNETFKVGLLVKSWCDLLCKICHIFLCVLLIMMYKSTNEMIILILFILGTSMLVSTFVMSFIILIIDMNKHWKLNTINGSYIFMWISTYTIPLFLLSVLFGSTFPVIGIFNSNAFIWDVFSMGLSQRMQHVFQTKNVSQYIENILFLVIQIILLNKLDYRPIIIIISIVFTGISMLQYTFILFKSFAVFQNDEYMVITLELTFSGNSKEFRNVLSKNISLINELSQRLKIHPKTMQLIKPIKTQDGYKYNFLIDIKSYGAVIPNRIDVLSILKKDIPEIEYSLEQIFGLSTAPNITHIDVLIHGNDNILCLNPNNASVSLNDEPKQRSLAKQASKTYSKDGDKSTSNQNYQQNAMMQVSYFIDAPTPKAIDHRMISVPEQNTIVNENIGDYIMNTNGNVPFLPKKKKPEGRPRNISDPTNKPEIGKAYSEGIPRFVDDIKHDISSTASLEQKTHENINSDISIAFVKPKAPDKMSHSHAKTISMLSSTKSQIDKLDTFQQMQLQHKISRLSISQSNKSMTSIKKAQHPSRSNIL